MCKPIIRIEKACKAFQKQLVLKELSVEFAKGAIHGLIGRNGSGKTVLLKCICGFIPLDSGKIWVDGKEIGKDIDVPGNTGVIIETPGFLPQYSGLKNLIFLASIQRKVHRTEIEESMRSVGLNPHDKKAVGKYSLGMRQRLGLAQALMEKPSLLVLDEPMSGLDQEGVEEIRTLLLKLSERGVSILLASHSSDDIGMLCDSVHRIDAGRLIRVR